VSESLPQISSGKIGTDIIDNKCSWCINTALALSSPAQCAILNEHYGRKDAMSEAKVKEGLWDRYKVSEVEEVKGD
jgi:farnesyl diphosphate synthase